MCKSIVYGPKYKDSQNEEIEYGSYVIAKFEPGYKVKNDGVKFPGDDFVYVKELGNNWQKGHLLAKRFGGSDESENMLPMTMDANLLFRDKVENKLSDLLGYLYELNNIYQMHHDNEQIKIEYKVEVSSNTIKIGEGIEVPESFTAKIDIIRKCECGNIDKKFIKEKLEKEFEKRKQKEKTQEKQENGENKKSEEEIIKEKMKEQERKEQFVNYDTPITIRTNENKKEKE